MYVFDVKSNVEYAANQIMIPAVKNSDIQEKKCCVVFGKSTFFDTRRPDKDMNVLLCSCFFTGSIV